MDKTELIEAIQQVITPNNQKAITAESLANLLIEIVSNMGTGSGSGSGVVFYAGTPNEDLETLVLTPEQKAHNAEMVQIVKNSPIALCASIDATEVMIANMSAEYVGVDLTGVKYNFNGEEIMYVPAPIAGLGTPSTGVLVYCGIPLFIAEDGSVSVLS